MIAPNPGADIRRLLADVFEADYRPRRLLGRSPKTAYQYHVCLRHFARWLGEPPALIHLEDSVVCKFLADYAAAGRAPATVNKTRSHLLALWNFAARKGLTSTWPDVPVMPDYRRRPLAWTAAEVERILDSAERRTGTVCGIPAGLLWSARLRATWETGWRLGAINALRPADCDFAAGVLTARAETQKHRTEERRRVSPATAATLRAIESPERDRLFPYEGCLATLFNHYREIVRDAGLPHDRKHLFHCLRKSHATLLDAAGGDATASLGHSSREITAAYLDPSHAQRPDPVDLLPSLPPSRLLGDADRDRQLRLF